MWTKKNSEMKTREQFCQIVAVEFIECVCRFHLRLLKLQCERRELLPVLRFTLPTVHTEVPCSPIFLLLSFNFGSQSSVSPPRPICPFLPFFLYPRASLPAPPPAPGSLAPGVVLIVFPEQQRSTDSSTVVSTFNVLVPP